MGGNSDKTSGGTRNYASQPGTMSKRGGEFNQLMSSGNYDRENSYFDKSGGFLAVHNEHNLNADELDAGCKLAHKGYKVYLDSEHSTISGGKTKDGRLYRSPMDMKAIGEAGKWSIKREVERAARQGAETVVLIQRTQAMTREYVDDQVQKIKTYSPPWAKARIKHLIVVGLKGNIHRRNL